jgi:hypothetical protein
MHGFQLSSHQNSSEVALLQIVQNLRRSLLNVFQCFKMWSLEMILCRKKEEEATWIEVWWVSEVIRDHGGFCRQKLFDGKRRVWGRVATAQDQLVGASYEEPLSQTLQILNIKLLVDSLTKQYKRWMHYFVAVKETNHNFIVFWLWHPRCLWEWLEISITCSAALSQGYTEEPSFHPQLWLFSLSSFPSIHRKTS